MFMLSILMEDDLHAGALDLVDQEVLDGVGPRQPIGVEDIEAVAPPGRPLLGEPLHRRSDQDRPADRLVDEALLFHRGEATVGYPLSLRDDLPIYGLIAGLLLGGDACIEGGTQMAFDVHVV